MHPKVLLTIAVSLLCITAGCAGLGGGPGGSDAQTTQPSDGASIEPSANEGADAGTDEDADLRAAQVGEQVSNYTALYEETINSVVEIRVETARGQGQGSGFLYNDEGYVVTNQHVVRDSQTVSVGFASGEWHTGEVVGTDVYTDLAVVRVDSVPETAEPIPLARSTPVPGQPVAAIGSPLGFQGSITQGIVSGTNRSMPVAQGFSIPDTVQTDAPINPGNSGGPLVSMNARVVGVNRAKTGDNIGFAISATVVEEVVPSLVEDGEYAHSYVGIRMIPVTPDVAEANGLNRTAGMMVVGTPPNSPAAGVLDAAERQQTASGRPTYVGGDVIVGIDGQSIENQHDLARHLLLHTEPGQEIEVTVLREGDRVTETVTLGRRPAPETERGL